MIKSFKAEIIKTSLITIIIIILFASLLIELYFISLSCFILCILIGLYYEIQERTHPYIKNPEEIKKLKNQLEYEDIRNFIKDSFFNKGKSIQEISKSLESKFNIELLIPKGYHLGDFKSKELIEKLYQILGYTNYKEYSNGYRKYKH